MLIKIYPQNPNPVKISKVVECLKSGGIIIYPTDTVYSLGCDMYQPKAVARVASVKGIRPEKANFSIITNDLSKISEYTRPFETEVYKLMKKTLPGPFTFILKANSKIPRIFQSPKKTIGIRVPNNNITRNIVTELGNPIISTSIYDDDQIIEYTVDPELIYEKYSNNVDIVIDGGAGGNIPSTVIDCTGGQFSIVRQGKGDLGNYN